MNTAHWHLTLNHLPIVGTMVSTFLLIIGLVLKNQTLKTTGLAFFILTALFGIPALLTGEGAEDVLESIGQKNGKLIHEHEEQAESAFWLAVSIGVLSIGTLLAMRSKKKIAQLLTVMVLIGGIGSSVFMTIVGNSGGQIRHSEIRPANTNAVQDNNAEGVEKHDD